LGWYYYLEDRLQFPFTAKCRGEKQTNRLKKEDECKVIAMADPEECDSDMYVIIEDEGDHLAVNLSQLIPAKEDDTQTWKAIAAWHYWIDQGYQF